MNVHLIGAVVFIANFAFYSVSKASAFASIQSAETTVRTVDQIKLSLEPAASKFGTVQGRQVPVVDRASIAAAIACLRNGSFIKTANPNLDEINHDDGGEFGSGFGNDATQYKFEIEIVPPPLPKKSTSSLSAETVSLKAFNDVISNRRDIVINFEGKSSGSVSNSLDLIVNGTLVYRSPLFRNDKSFKFTINKKFLQTGNNSIVIKPTFSNRIWGVTNIQADYTPIVPLTFNQIDRTRYGSNEPPVLRPTGLRTSFELSDLESNVRLKALGLAVNYNEEIEVYLNGRFQGTMVKSRSGIPDVFTFAKSSLIEGTNVIEFYQADNVTLEHTQWGVTNILITKVSASSSPPIITFLLDDE